MKKTEVAALVNKQRKESQRSLGAQYQNTKTCIEFYNGDTMSYQDRIQFTTAGGQRKKATVQFNSVQSPVDSIVGFMAQNRRRAKFMARVESTDEQEIYNKYMNALYDYTRSNNNADHVETDQDVDMVINGYGAIETDISYIMGNATMDPNGEIIKVRLDPETVGWDAAAKARNLLDARWVYYFDEYSLKDALALFQNSTEEDFAAASEMESDDDNEDGYNYNPYGGVYTRIKENDAAEWVSREDERVRVYNHQWFEYETFYRAKNPVYLAQTPEDAIYFKARLEFLIGAFGEENLVGPDEVQTTDMFSFDPSVEILTLTEKQKRVLVREFGPGIEPIPFKRKCFYTAVYSGKHVFSVFKSLSQQGFSVKFKTGVYDASKKIWTGVVNALIEPTKYKNKALTELMFAIASNSKGGVLVESDAVEDIAVFEGKWAKTDAVIEVNSGALANGKIQDKARAQVPTGLDGIIALSEQAIRDNGVDPAFLGNISEQQQSGILYKRCIRQVISKLARYFDSITLYQKEDARLNADLIRVWVQNNNGQFVRITGEDYRDEFLQITEDNMAAEYDISIQEAPQTPEDRQETAETLGAFGDKLAAVGNMPAAGTFYAESLQYMPLDGDVRSRLTKALQPDESEMVPAQMVQQLQAQIQQMQSELSQVQIEKVRTESALNMARAEQERSKAMLAEIKARQEESKTKNIEVDSIKKLEEASRIGYENDLLKSGNFSDVNVSI